MIQNRLWKANPQALAAVQRRTKAPESLVLDVDRTIDDDTWLTPRWILDYLGEFDLDPCAALVARDHVCSNCYTIDDNGLALPWSGRVFMNPPFSNTAKWLEKHARHGNGISLVPATVESNVWKECVWKCARSIFLLHGRTRFLNPDGSTTSGRPLRSVALIAWSGSDSEILEAAPFCGVFLNQWNRR